ncbi:hypothetical protein [Sulfitobacter donghicola]|uniref:Uncharacterized protein n=1 Tax=Sulfitobacter donghicola DSW-25 = KCTC 12864 = JCM 14565 TaxID=1300350 RepID=A0A073IDK0_9RHOB|nr:hypothetical protein [Sulfitobacter donghicola]KEJ87824.1 hypothetical protein DSW25_04915 [Sulfitobacter donghicola DSW-25 = KCTC 12864 = JCM 14565]
MKKNTLATFLASAASTVVAASVSAQSYEPRYIISEDDMQDLEGIFNALPIQQRSELSRAMVEKTTLLGVPLCPPDLPTSGPLVPAPDPTIATTVLPDEVPDSPIVPLNPSTPVDPSSPLPASDPTIALTLVSPEVLPEWPGVPNEPIVIDPSTGPRPEIVDWIVSKYGVASADPDDPEDPPEAFVEIGTPPETWAEWQPAPEAEQFDFNDSTVRMKFSNGFQTRTDVNQFLSQDEVQLAFQRFVCGSD